MKLFCRFMAIPLAVLLSMSSLLRDSAQLSDQILRLHVVAASDSAEDQRLKLLVRDAVLDRLEQQLEGVTEEEQAEQRIRAAFPLLQQAAEEVLRRENCTDSVQISLEEEEFPARQYDTFRLPAGVYRSLRLRIGEGKGANWWCVVFPELCAGATAEEFTQTAQLSGMPESLTQSLTGEYEIRFWLLDQLGNLRNFLRRDSA